MYLRELFTHNTTQLPQLSCMLGPFDGRALLYMTSLYSGPNPSWSTIGIIHYICFKTSDMTISNLDVALIPETGVQVSRKLIFCFCASSSNISKKAKQILISFKIPDKYINSFIHKYLRQRISSVIC